MKLILTAFLALWLASCQTSRIYYAEAEITIKGSKITLKPISQFKPMPDTTVRGYLIRKQ